MVVVGPTSHAFAILRTKIIKIGFFFNYVIQEITGDFLRYTFESKDSAQLSICDDNLFVFVYTFVIKFTARGHCPQDSFRFV